MYVCVMNFCSWALGMAQYIILILATDTTYMFLEIHSALDQACPHGHGHMHLKSPDDRSRYY